MMKFYHQLTKIQLQERANRKHRARLMMGVPTKKGTPPLVYRPVEEPWFHPIPRTPMDWAFLAPLLSLPLLRSLRRLSKHDDIAKLQMREKE